MIIIGVYCFSLIISWYIFKSLYRFLSQKKIIDVPNERSMHSIPKIRGGGLAILIAFELCITILFFLGKITFVLYITQLLGGVILGCIGSLDDIYNLNAGMRFLLHILVSILTVIIFDGFNSVNILGTQINIFFIGNIFIVLYIIWMINLYNFMDGIDGLAITQMIVPSLFLFVFFMYNGHLSVAYLIAAIIITGIPLLIYNWPPAKIFMGDAFSGFLGFYWAVLTLYINNVLDYSFFLIPTLMSVFILDTGITLVKRVIKKEKIWEAHCSHYYQYFAKIYGHKIVTTTVIIINLLLFIPSYFIIKMPDLDIYITSTSYIIITAFLLLLKEISNKKLVKNNIYQINKSAG